MRSPLFRDVMQRRSVVSCRRFGSSHRSHVQESSSPSPFKMGPIALNRGFPDAFQQLNHQNQAHLFLPTFPSLLLFICLFLYLTVQLFLSYCNMNFVGFSLSFLFQVRHPHCVISNYGFENI